MAKQLQSGDLDRRADILQPETLVTELGEESGQSLGPFKLGLWCKWEELGGSETPESNRETAFGKVKATFRFGALEGVTEKMTVRYAGRDYDIENIRELPEPRRMWKELSLKRHD